MTDDDVESSQSSAHPEGVEEGYGFIHFVMVENIRQAKYRVANSRSGKAEAQGDKPSDGRIDVAR